MYRNPLNDGDISDYNSLKKQRDYGAIVKKYQSRKLKTEPNELQKYYQYMTYQQPILDELNYVAERMKNENIQKKKEDFNFIEDLKIKREKEMKEKSKLEEDIKKVRESLFDNSSTLKSDDMTPTIATDMELQFEPLTPDEEVAVRQFFEREERRLSEDEIKDRASKAIQARTRSALARERRKELEGVEMAFQVVRNVEEKQRASRALQARVRASLARKRQNELVQATTAIQARMRASLAGNTEDIPGASIMTGEGAGEVVRGRGRPAIVREVSGSGGAGGAGGAGGIPTATVVEGGGRGRGRGAGGGGGGGKGAGGGSGKKK